MAKLEQYQVDKTGGLSFYSDLDQDGYSEKIVSFEDMLGRSAIRVTTYDDKIVDQWAFEGKLPPRNHNLSVFTGDFNQDGLEELFSLYRSGDSVFLDIITPMDPRVFEKRKIFIDRIGDHAEKADYSVQFERLMDMNGDEKKSSYSISMPASSCSPVNYICTTS
ncbi:MAG: hypothetical protein U5Q03_12005 [Bacteroidota bacterium]|nr:hypothetical protein [Bacteroidota bacterium]